MAKKRIVIGATTSATFASRQDRCRRLWLNAANRYPDVESMLVAGRRAEDDGNEAVRSGDVLYLNCGDDYGSLRQKTKKFLQYVTAHFDFDYVFKCDDDTYVQVDRLRTYDCSGRDYVGHDYGKKIRFPSYGHGGGGYFLSRRAAEIAAAKIPDEAKGPEEDLMVATVLARNGILLSPDDERFLFSWEPWRVPKPGNETVTIHYVNSDERERFVLDQWAGYQVPQPVPHQRH